MPLYEYECTQCGRIDEALQKFSDKPLRKCKHCSGKLHKLVSQSSFHLKGSGWYVTDYARKSGDNGSKEPSGPSKETDKSSKESSGESKSSPSEKKPASTP